ncbi:MAG: hypothetical protein J6T74_04355 [Clostridia bacterium]|nr:hypothetical protein [Clostridia bacterium]
MKKRFKLLSTIASLCLALAMVVFGVYAATSVQIRTEGTYINIVCDHVLVDITIEYYQGPAGSLFSSGNRTHTFTGHTYVGSVDIDGENLDQDITAFTDATFSPTLAAQAVTYTSSAPSAGVLIKLTNVSEEDQDIPAYVSIKTLPPTTGGSDKLVDSSNSTVTFQLDDGDGHYENYTTANTAFELPPISWTSSGKSGGYYSSTTCSIRYQRTLNKFATTFSSETCWSSIIKIANSEEGAEA